MRYNSSTDRLDSEFAEKPGKISKRLDRSETVSRKRGNS
jgi:hypothetical protein